MRNATLTAPPRTEAQVMQEMAEAVVRLTMLELELKRIRNPDGLTVADLEGVFAGADLVRNEFGRFSSAELVAASSEVG